MIDTVVKNLMPGYFILPKSMESAAGTTLFNNVVPVTIPILVIPLREFNDAPIV
jgi:hypothetical protein